MPQYMYMKAIIVVTVTATFLCEQLLDPTYELQLIDSSIHQSIYSILSIHPFIRLYLHIVHFSHHSLVVFFKSRFAWQRGTKIGKLIPSEFDRIFNNIMSSIEIIIVLFPPAVISLFCLSIGSFTLRTELPWPWRALP